MIPLTVPEVRRVVARIVFAGRRDPQKVLAWLDWRRWDQQVAKENHDTTRGHPPLQL